MKILFLNSFSAVQGGAERLLLDTSKNLLKEGHQVSLVVANDDRHIKGKEFWPGRVNRYYLPELLVPLNQKSTFQNYRRRKKYLDCIRYFQDIIDIEAPDIIHVHNFPSIEVLKDLKLNVPLIRTIHSYENLCRSRMKIFADGSICNDPLGGKCKEICGFDDCFLATRIRAENRFMKKNFSRIIAISSWIKQVLLLNGFSEKQVKTICNFTNLEPQLTAIEEQHQILYVGRITSEKGLEELIDAVGKTKTKPMLRIAGINGLLGKSDYENQLELYAQNAGICLRLEPWAEKEELERLFRTAKIVAFSSIWPEPFGLVGIEAMRCGKAVIAFDAGGVRDWLEDGVNGFVVPHLDTDAYAERIDQLLMDDSLRQKMGEAGCRMAQTEFSPARYMEQLLGLYREVIHENFAH